MANREKRSLFDWLTGGTADPDALFDDLETGTAEEDAHPSSKEKAVHPTIQHTQVSGTEPFEVLQEEMEGELSVDLYQSPTHIIIRAFIAGVKPEDLDVSLTRDLVTIRGKRERAQEGIIGDHFVQELYWGSFSRTLVLPQEVDIEAAEASEKHGLLTLKLPKTDKGRQTKVKIKSN